MKNICFLIALFGFINGVSAQNTFPTTGNTGIGTLSPLSLLDIKRTDVSTSGFSNHAVSIDNVVNPVANSTSQHTALSTTANWISSFNATDGNFGLIGLNGAAINAGTGTVANLVAFNGTSGMYGAGIATNATSFRATLARYGTGSVINYRGFYVATPIFTSSTINNIYGLYIENQTLGSVDNFAVYTAGATKSYFGGKIGIGSTNPNSLLELSSNSDLSANPGESNTRLSLINRSSAINSQSDIIFGSADASTDTKSIYGAITGNVTGSGSGGHIGALIFSTKPSVHAVSLTERMRIDKDGNVSIGTLDSQGYKFAVNGNAIATAVTVKLNNDWPDYVFHKNYILPPLTEVKNYIDQNHHLPGMPTASQVEKDGLNLGEINTVLTEKVEELTLYLIEKDQQLKTQQEEINQLKEQFKEFKQQQR